MYLCIDVCAYVRMCVCVCVHLREKQVGGKGGGDISERPRKSIQPKVEVVASRHLCLGKIFYFIGNLFLCLTPGVVSRVIQCLDACATSQLLNDKWSQRAGVTGQSHKLVVNCVVAFTGSHKVDSVVAILPGAECSLQREGRVTGIGGRSGGGGGRFIPLFVRQKNSNRLIHQRGCRCGRLTDILMTRAACSIYLLRNVNHCEHFQVLFIAKTWP